LRERGNARVTTALSLRALQPALACHFVPWRLRISGRLRLLQPSTAETATALGSWTLYGRPSPLLLCPAPYALRCRCLLYLLAQLSLTTAHICGPLYQQRMRPLPACATSYHIHGLTPVTTRRRRRITPHGNPRRQQTKTSCAAVLRMGSRRRLRHSDARQTFLLLTCLASTFLASGPSWYHAGKRDAATRHGVGAPARRRDAPHLRSSSFCVTPPLPYAHRAISARHSQRHWLSSWLA